MVIVIKMAGRPKKPVADWDGGQQTLFGRPRGGNPKEADDALHPRVAARRKKRQERADQEEDEGEGEASEEPARKKAARGFMQSWKVIFEWLLLLTINGVEYLSCSVCRRAMGIDSTKFSRGIGPKPTKAMKKETLTEHVTSKEHIKALEMCQKADLQMEAEEGEQNRADIRQLMAHGSDLEARQKMVQMAALFHVIKQNQSIASFTNMRDLLKTLNVKIPAMHWSGPSASELASAMEAVLLQELQKIIKEAGVFGLSFDDSKAIDDSEYMSVEVYWVSSRTGQQDSAFLRLKEVQDVGADSLHKKLMEVLEEMLGIKPADLHRHLVGVASDGASVNVGHVSGIVTRLREEYVPHLDNVHCMAHIVQLSAKKIGEDSISQDCIDLLADAYSYCCNSPQRVAAVRDQQIAADIAQLKLLKLSDTRWLSLSNCLRTYLLVEGAVLRFIDDESNKRGNLGNRASHLKERMLDLGVILQLRALYNLVETLRMLSCNLQTRGISYSGAMDMINEAIDLITAEYITGGGAWDGRAWNDLINFNKPPGECDTASPLCFYARSAGVEVATLHYAAGGQQFEVHSFTKHHTVNVNRGQRRTTVLECRTFMRTDGEEIAGKIQDAKIRISAVAAQVVADLQERTRRNELQASFDVIDPAFWKPIGEDGTAADELFRKQEALRKLDVLYDRYASGRDMDFGIHEGKTLDPLLHKGRMQLEWDAVLGALQSRAGKKSMDEYWGLVLRTPAMIQHIPQFAQLAKIAKTFPITSVENERQFSQMNAVKNKSRNKMGEGLLNALCRIKRSSYTVENFPYAEAQREWAKQKSRRGVDL